MKEYTEIELQLIEAGKKDRESPNRDMTAFYDGTPFTILENGIKVRATFSNGQWGFKAIVRRGYTGTTCKKLEQSIKIAIEEKAQWEKELSEQIERERNNLKEPP